MYVGPVSKAAALLYFAINKILGILLVPLEDRCNWISFGPLMQILFVTLSWFLLDSE